MDRGLLRHGLGPLSVERTAPDRPGWLDAVASSRLHRGRDTCRRRIWRDPAIRVAAETSSSTRAGGTSSRRRHQDLKGHGIDRRCPRPDQKQGDGRPPERCGARPSGGDTDDQRHAHPSSLHRRSIASSEPVVGYVGSGKLAGQREAGSRRFRHVYVRIAGRLSGSRARRFPCGRQVAQLFGVAGSLASG